MKSLLLLAALVFTPAFCEAQTAPCKITFQGKFLKPASVALDYIETVCGYKVVYGSANDVPQSIINLEGKSYDTVDAAVSDIINNVGFTAQIDNANKTITVRRQTAPVTASNNPPLPPVPLSGFRHPCSLPNMYTIPRVYSPSLGMTEAEWITASNRLPCSPGYPIPTAGFATSSQQFDYQAVAYGAYGGGSPWFYDPVGRFFEDEKNRRTYGLLKIDGPDRFLQDVRVLVDGYDMTVASKANNKWNSPVVMGAGPHIVEFIREKSSGPVAFQRRVMVQPMSVTGREPAWLRVSGNEFENARELYEYRQHRYVEDPEGKTSQVKPKP